MTLARLVLVAVVAAALGAGTAARQAAGGTIRGHVIVAAVAGPGDRPLVSDLSARRPDATDRRRAVVYLEGGLVPAFGELRTPRARMDQRGEQFFPRILAITVGTTVDFPNNDTTFHNVFSLSRVEPFDLCRYRPGRTGSIVFRRTGIVPVFCDIHTHMSAYILVFNHPFFAVTAEDGSYTIAGVPPGTYNLLVWSELGRGQPRRITVVEGAAVEADFRIERSGS
jgi:plastocyanin